MTINKLLNQNYKKLYNSGIESYQLDSQIILANLLDVDRTYLHINKHEEVLDEIAQRYGELIDLRCTGCPIKYITMNCEFMNMTFYIEKGVFIPRYDTEVLVEAVLNKINERELESICDVCCGSGVIGISLLKLSRAKVAHLFDISDKAIDIAKINSLMLDVVENTLIEKSDLLSYAIENNIKYDLIVSNPPYIKTSEMMSLMKDVRDFEPTFALDGGEDGLEFYRRIVRESRKCLNENGYLCLEIGYDEKIDVINILEENNFEEIESYKDLNGYDRVVLGLFKT